MNDPDECEVYLLRPAAARKNFNSGFSDFQADQNRLRSGILRRSWVPICHLFSSGQNRQRLFTYQDQQPGIINMLLGSAGDEEEPRPVIVIDISRQGNERFWSEELQRRILNKLLNILVSQATSSLSTDSRAPTCLFCWTRPIVTLPVEGWTKIQKRIGYVPCYEGRCERRGSTGSGGSSSARR